MIKIKETKSETVTLIKNNKQIKRTYTDYKTNQKMWEFRGWKLQQDVIKDEKVVELKPKKKTRKKKDVQVDLVED